MTKEEAAAFLNRSVRVVQRYASQGRLSVTYSKGERGNVAVFDADEVARLKEELENPAYLKQRAALAAQFQQPMSPVTSDVAETLNKIVSSFGDQLVEALAKLQPKQLPAPRSPERVRLAEKLTLSVAEAAMLSGLAESDLEMAIKRKRIKVIISGKTRRILRSDLEAFLKRLRK